jgi:hypothetical protein
MKDLLLWTLAIVSLVSSKTWAAAEDLPDARAARMLQEHLERAMQPPVERARSTLPAIVVDSAPDDLPRNLAPLTPVLLDPQRPILAGERPAAMGKLPVYDLPPLAGESVPQLPAVVQLPTTARAYVWSPDALAVPALARLGTPLAERATISEDPVAAEARAAMLAGRVPSDVKSPLQLEQRIADPIQHVRAARLGAPLADTDPAATTFMRPLRPQLPVAETPSP